MGLSLPPQPPLLTSVTLEAASCGRVCGWKAELLPLPRPGWGLRHRLEGRGPREGAPVCWGPVGRGRGCDLGHPPFWPGQCTQEMTGSWHRA